MANHCFVFEALRIISLVRSSNGDTAHLVIMTRGSRNLFRLNVSMSMGIGTIQMPSKISR